MPAGQDLPILELHDSAAWASWLDSNRAASVWLKIAKKGSPRSTVTQAEAIDEAICYGWIDGQLRRHDEHFFLQLHASPPAQQMVGGQPASALDG